MKMIISPAELTCGQSPLRELTHSQVWISRHLTHLSLFSKFEIIMNIIKNLCYFGLQSFIYSFSHFVKFGPYYNMIKAGQV